MPQLVIVEGPDMGKTFELGDENVIGTGTAASVLIHDRRVAARQAAIRRDNGAYVLANLDTSRNLTVNGEVLVSARLQHGDMISIAGTMMLFSDDPGERPPAATAAPDTAADDLLTSQILSRQARFTDAQSIIDHFHRVPKKTRAASRLATLYRISQAINECLELDPLLERLMEVIVGEFDADRGFLMLAEEGRTQLVPRIAWERKGGRSERPPRFSRTILREVVTQREGILCGNAKDDERFLSGQSIIDQGIASTLCVPLLRQDKLLGVLQLDSLSAGRSFTEDDLDHLSKIAMQAAVAIDTVETYEEPKQFSKNLRSLGRATQWLSSYLQRDEIIKETVTFACSIFQCQRASLTLADETTGKLRVPYAIGLAKEIWEQVELEPGQGLAGRVVAQGTPLLVPDPRTGTTPPGLPSAPGGRYKTDSFLIVPILARTSEIDPEETRVIGSIQVTDKLDGRCFQRNDQELLTILAHQAGIALTNALLYERATVDTLTRLYVRRFFFQRLSELLRRCRRQEKPLSLLMCDLDHFKSLNDTHGHPAGDAVLAGTGEVLRRTVRGRDVPARYGGEEFAIILPETPLEVAEKVGERVRAALAGTGFPHDGETLQVTVSVGLAELGADDSREDLIKKADDALYQAKDGGRNRVCAYRGA